MTEYAGLELSVFAHATCWKAYFRRLIAPWFGDVVLEVGAGFGGTTSALRPGRVRRWVCLEPDGVMAGQLADRIARAEVVEEDLVHRRRNGHVDAVPGGQLGCFRCGCNAAVYVVAKFFKLCSDAFRQCFSIAKQTPAGSNFQ